MTIWKNRTARPGALARLILLASASMLVLAAQEPSKTIKRVTAQPPVSENGDTLFKEYCAVCHGKDAKGGGPAADALKKRPADLTQLSRKNDGKFPEFQVLTYIQGRDATAAHGSRDMPIWGSVFSQMNSNKDLGPMRISNLIQYLQQIQAK